MDKDKKVLAVLCGGGPAPGINAVIAAVAKHGIEKGYEVIGIYEGFSRLAKKDTKHLHLTSEIVDPIVTMGGAILQMSRYNPTKKNEDLENVLQSLQALHVSALVTIGGDDTAFSARKVAEYAQSKGTKIQVVHVPKTIDNDLPLPEGIPTFGYETARAFGTNEVKNLLSDAYTTNNRWYFAIAMGRTAGHLALGIGKAAGVPLIVIPEEFLERTIHLQELVDIVTGSIVKRYLKGQNYGVAVIAEGVIEKIAEEDLKKLGNLQLDEHGHLRYSELDFGRILKTAVLEEIAHLDLKLSIVNKDIGYELRCANPIPYDIEYATNLGHAAVEFLDSGKTGAMISIGEQGAAPLYFEDIKDEKTGKTKVRYVSLDSHAYTIAKSFMTKLVKRDLQDKDVQKVYKLNEKEIEAKLGYLFQV